MKYHSAEEVLNTLIQAYYEERNVENTLQCVTEDIQWVGTEHNDSANGKDELRKLLEADVEAFSDRIDVQFDAPQKQILQEKAVLFTVSGRQEEMEGVANDFLIRGTVCCVYSQEDGWLICNVHASVPNAQLDNYKLKVALDKNRMYEKTIMSNIPGGIAIYRLKKDGRVITEYISDGLATMSGYNKDEFFAYLKDNSYINVVPEDIPLIQKAIKESFQGGDPISIRYRIYTKAKQEIMIRLDARQIEFEELAEDDVAVFYAMHTPVSEEAQQIIQGQKQLQQLVNGVPGGIGIYEIEDGIAKLSFLNDAYYKMLGFSREERKQFLGKKHITVIHPEDIAKMNALILALTSGKTESAVQYRIQNKKGDWVWLNLAASVVEQNSNQMIVYASFTDCNELMQSKQVIEDAQFRLTALLDNIPGGVAIYRVKKDGRIPTDYVSDGLARVCGYDDAADIMKVMNPDSRKLVFEEDYPRVGAACKNSLVTGEPTHVNYRVYGKDGSAVWLSLDSVIMKNAILEEDDAAVFYAVQAPVSADALRAKAEQDYYRAILDITKTAYFEMDAKENFYASETFGRYMLNEYGPEAIRGGKSALRCIHPDDVKKVSNYLRQISQNNMDTSVIVRLLMKDGNYQWTEVTGHVEFDENHNILRVTGILRNINAEWENQKEDLEKALKDAKNANKAKTEFLSRVSHDMRTPLNGILGLTHILKDATEDGDILRDLDELEISGKYLLNLINDTLDVNRIESGKLELHPVVCEGRTFFNTAIGLAKTSIEAKNLKYEVHADNLPFTVLYTDVARMEQVIMNVVSNAVKFTPAGGKIDITIKNISVENGVITDQIIITDTGIGMSPEFLPHIFEAFAQEDASRTSTAQGTGLGMSITKQLIQLMGGDISVTSQQGKGSCFTITARFPIATDEQIKEWKMRQSKVENGAELSGRHILLCEDHPLNAEIATRLLEAKGVLVEHAINGQQGVEMFSDSAMGHYDAILMDIRMPVLDGIGATKSIRALSRSDAASVPIIAMTANAFYDDVQETQNAGMTAHLSKPIQPDLLFETLCQQIQVKSDDLRRRILVVDDVEINRAAIKASLEDEYDIIEAESGLEALDILEHTRGIDVLITDLQMPKMNGVELIRKIRSSKQFRHLIIIANTQFGDMEQEEELLALGADNFIYKPTTPRIVANRVRNSLRKIY